MAVFVSGSDERYGKDSRDRFYFGGWVGPEEDWSRFFAPAWQERVLDGPPSIPYIHMTDIRSRAWREKWGISELDADDRVEEAFRLLGQMATVYPVGLHFDGGFIRDEFKTLKVVNPITKGASNFEPDYIGFLVYAYVVLEYVHLSHRDAEKVDFIVEMNGHITKYIQAFHGDLVNTMNSLGRPELANLVGQLIPGDKERVPLQAADLLLWHTGRERAIMTEKERMRYYKIAHRPGKLIPVSNDLLLQLKASFGSSNYIDPSMWSKGQV